MSWLSLKQIAAMVDGRLKGDDVAVDEVSTDTRTLAPGSLFIALRGERYDAHDFISADLPAAAVMVDREVATALPQVIVDDTHDALGRLAAAWRARLTMPVIGLTGSNGKTTVKEMIAAILGVKGRVLATKGNLNNDIGLPLSLLAVRPEHDYAVLEMGANHFGEIDYLTKIASPDVALITNAGPAHLEGFGTIEGVSRAKGELFAGLGEDGVAVINADDTYADYWRSLNAGRRVCTFGLDHEADFHGDWQPGAPLSLSAAGGAISIELPLPGRHNASNALAAAAATSAVGVSLEDIKRGLEAMHAVAGRLQAKIGHKGARVIDDTYNANPASLRAAIEVLAAMSGERWLVLGDMRELGEDVDALHAQAGEQAREAGIDHVYSLGENSRCASEAFGGGAQHFEDADTLIKSLREALGSSVTVLVKGSRGMRMERVVQGLLNSDADPSAPEREYAV